MATEWIGPANFLFIPLIVEDTPGYFPPPAGYRELVERMVHEDLDESGEDRSLASYISSISYGQARLNAVVSEPVTISQLSAQDNPTLLAINAHPDAHKYEYLAVVYPPNEVGAGSGMAQSGRIDFDPPREPNRTKARSRFLYNERLGTWAMEVIHNVTNIGDYYNGESGPGNFEQMDDAGATHPTSYTKLKAGWLDPESVPLHPDGTETYTLHAIGMPHPAPDGRVAAVKVQDPDSDRYVIVEARLRSDRWERGFTASAGIPSEGVIAVEYAPDWPKVNPNGPQPPLQLRTPDALQVGERFSHRDARAVKRDKDGVADHRDGGPLWQVSVKSAVSGGFVIEIGGPVQIRDHRTETQTRERRTETQTRDHRTRTRDHRSG